MQLACIDMDAHVQPLAQVTAVACKGSSTRSKQPFVSQEDESVLELSVSPLGPPSLSESAGSAGPCWLAGQQCLQQSWCPAFSS